MYRGRGGGGGGQVVGPGRGLSGDLFDRVLCLYTIIQGALDRGMGGSGVLCQIKKNTIIVCR